MSSQGLARHTMLSGVASFSTSFGSFIASVLVARMLGVEASGEVAYALWIALFISIIAALGTDSTLARFIADFNGRGERDEAQRIANRMFRAIMAGAVGILMLVPAGLLVAGAFGGKTFGFGTAGFALIVAGLAVLTLLAQVATGYLRGQQRFSTIAKLNLTSMVLQLVAIGALGYLFGVWGAICGYAIGRLLPAVAAFTNMMGPVEVAAENWQRVRTYGWYVWAGDVVSAIVWLRAEVFFLEHAFGAHTVGIYAAALTVAALATQGPAMLTGALLPHFSQHVGRNDTAEMHRLVGTGTRLFALVLFPSCFGVAAIAPVLVPLIFGEPFRDAVAITMVLVSAAALTGTATVIFNTIYAYERSDFVMWVAAAAALAFIAAGLLIIPVYGAMGAAVSRAVIQTLLVIAMGWFLVKKLKCPYPVADLMRIIAAAGVSAVAAYLVVSQVGLGPLVKLAAAVPAGVIAYGTALWLFGGLHADDRVLLQGYAGKLLSRIGLRHAT